MVKSIDKFFNKMFNWIPTPAADYCKMESILLEHKIKMMHMFYNANLSDYDRAVTKQKATPTLRLIEGDRK